MAFGPPEGSPLTDNDYRKINAALSSLAAARRKVDLAESAGITCQDRKDECDFLESQLEQLKNVYFPHKS